MSGEFVVVDANGNRIGGNRPPKKGSPTMKKPQLTRPVLKRSSKIATEQDLIHLEDAIFAHGLPYRLEFLNQIKVTKPDPIPDPEFEIFNSIQFNHYLESITWKPESRRMKALRHCWETLNWRPDKAHTRVWVKNPQNPYTKDK
jgi:hypothetical protein